MYTPPLTHSISEESQESQPIFISTQQQPTLKNKTLFLLVDYFYNMQRIPHKSQAAQRLQAPAGRSSLNRDAMEGHRGLRKNNNYAVSSSPRPRPVCTCSNHPGAVKCTRHGYAVPHAETLKKHSARKEVLRRALTPPPRRLSLRWFNFRPTPSRLSNMSVAN